MALTITVARGYTMVAGTQLAVADWNAAFLPTITISGGVGSADIADGAVGADQLSNQFLNGFAATTALALDDKFAIYDTSAAVNAGITVANALNGIFGLAATGASSFTSWTADKITMHNGTTAVTMTPARLAEQLLAQAPSLSSTVDSDEVLVHDASATDGSQATRVRLENLLPDVGTAGAYTGVTGLTTNTKGQVTAVATTGTGSRYTAPSPVALPTSAGTANAVVVDTALGAAPGIVTCWIRCTDAGGDAGYSQNDQVLLAAVHWDVGASDFNLPYTVQVDGEDVRVIQPAGSSPKIADKATGADSVFDPTKWGLLVNAIR